jgi:hypothetical protein
LIDRIQLQFDQNDFLSIQNFIQFFHCEESSFSISISDLLITLINSSEISINCDEILNFSCQLLNHLDQGVQLASLKLIYSLSIHNYFISANFILNAFEKLTKLHDDDFTLILLFTFSKIYF